MIRGRLRLPILSESTAISFSDKQLLLRAALLDRLLLNPVSKIGNNRTLGCGRGVEI